MKTIKIISLALLGALSLNSCLVDDELPEQQYLNNANVVEFDKSFQLFSYPTTEIEDMNELVNIDRIGGPQGTTNNTLNFSIEVDASSTAVAGTDYELTSTEITIESGNDNFQLPILVKTANLSTSESKTLVLNVISSDNVISTSDRNNSILVLLAKCSSDLHTFNYNTATTDQNDGSVQNHPNQSIREISAGNFRTDSTGTWADLGAFGAPDPGFNFTDVCGIIYVEDQDLAQGNWSNDVRGVVVDPLTGAHGSVDPVTGDITINYSIDFSGTATEYVAVYTKI